MDYRQRWDSLPALRGGGDVSRLLLLLATAFLCGALVSLAFTVGLILEVVL